MKYLIWFFALILPIQPFCQINPTTSFASDQLNQDWTVLVTTLRESYAARDEAGCKAVFQELEAEKTVFEDASGTYREFLSRVARLFADLQDPALSWSHPEAYFSWRNPLPILFPVDLEFREKEGEYSVWVKRTPLMQEGLTPGLEIIEFQDKTISDLVDEMLPLTPANACENLSLQWLSDYFSNHWVNFASADSLYHITLRDSKKRETKMTVPGMMRDALRDLHKTHYAADFSIGEAMELSFHDEIPVLTLRSLQTRQLGNLDGGFGGWMENCMRKIENAPHLVIDLRGMDWGDPEYVSMLLQFLVPGSDSLTCFSEHFRKLPDSITYEQYQVRKPVRSGNSLAVPVPNSGPGFEGKIHVILNRSTVQAKKMFAERLSMEDHVQLYSADPFCPDGNMSFNIRVITLPHTQLNIFIPAERLSLPETGESPRVLKIEPAISSKEYEPDGCLEQVLRKVKKNR